jgi:signal transduction histidine kinase
MRQSGQAGNGGGDRGRVETVVETLASLHNSGETLAEVAHDARNMVTALGLYCELLEQPGVLTPSYRHYGSELRLVATASRRLVEKLVALDGRAALPLDELRAKPGSSSRNQNQQRWEMPAAAPIENLAAEVLANRNLLAALAGPSITLTVEAEGGLLPVRLTGEDLTRVLVNLVKNAAEAMPGGGRIQITLSERQGKTGEAESLLLTVEDNGRGIPQKSLEKIFDSGYSTHLQGASQSGSWPASHRGLGLSITRSIVEAAGGHIFAAHHAGPGARFEMELPVERY